MQSASRRLKSTLKIPRSNDAEPSDHLEPTTPKTPADEGIEFFESAFSQGQPPIRVHELKLDPDGGPNKDRAVGIIVAYLSHFFDATFVSTFGSLLPHCLMYSVFQSIQEHLLRKMVYSKQISR